MSKVFYISWLLIDSNCLIKLPSLSKLRTYSKNSSIDITNTSTPKVKQIEGIKLNGGFKGNQKENSEKKPLFLSSYKRKYK